MRFSYIVFLVATNAAAPRCLGRRGRIIWPVRFVVVVVVVVALGCYWVILALLRLTEEAEQSSQNRAAETARHLIKIPDIADPPTAQTGRSIRQFIKCCYPTVGADQSKMSWYLQILG